MPYRVTYALDLFNGPHERELSRRALGHMLDCLFRIDVDYLRAHPETPSIYRSGVRYMEEPPGQEDWQDIPTCIRMGIGDCLPVSTLVLRDDYSFASLMDLQPGDRIMGDGQFTTVQEAAITGEKPVLSFGLDNGCMLRASPEHRVFLSDDREVLAKDVRVGDRLKAPSTAFPTLGEFSYDDRISSTDLAWLIGTYIADGWHQQTGNHQFFSISGFDEKPKRRKAEQKDRVLQICEVAAIAHTWRTKYISVRDRELADLMKRCGTHAPNKHVPTMTWSLDQVKALVEGLQTDCSTATSGTLTYGTTSPMLALQLRVLHRMLDQSVHIREWTAEQHRGLGKNSMYRVGIRKREDEVADRTETKSKARSSRTSVGVRTITLDEPELCADITTDTGRFYLPESDVIVHNCEDLACWRAAELVVRHNIQARPVFMERRRSNGSYLYHILVRYPDGRIEDPSKILGMQ